MKIPYVLFIVCAFALLLEACNLKAKRARQYHDEMLRSVQVVIDSSLEYGDAIQSHLKDHALSGYEQYDGLVNKTITKVQNAGNFENDSTLQKYSMELLNFYKASLEREFKPTLDAIKANEMSEDETHLVDSLFENFTLNESQYWDRFNWAEKKFYKDNQLESTEKK